MNAIVMLLGLLLAAASCAPVYAGMLIAPGTQAHTHSDANTGGGTLALSGTLSSTKACASGYTRVGPNFCKANSSILVWNVATNSLTCTQSTALSGVSDAKGVHIITFGTVVSANAVGYRSSSLRIYLPTDNTCASVVFDVIGYVYEFAATAADTEIGRAPRSLTVVSDTSGRFYARHGGATGAGTKTSLIYVTGYFD